MTRGRKPKPTALKLLQGNPGKRPINFQDPAFPAAGQGGDMAKPPKDLPQRGKELWNRFYPLLAKFGVLLETDLPAFEALCRSWALFKAADIQCGKKNGMIQESAGGYQSPSGWVTLRSKFYAEFRQLAEHFGLTPSARARIKITAPPPQKSLFIDEPPAAPDRREELEAFIRGGLDPVVGKIGRAG